MAENEPPKGGEQGIQDATSTSPTDQATTAPKPAPTAKAVLVHPGDDTTSLLQQRDEVERAIQLGAREDPSKVVLPGGEKLLDYRRRMAEEHEEEGRQTLEVNEKRMRQQSTAGDPLYREGGVVSFYNSGASAIVESKMEPPPVPAPSDTEKNDNVPDTQTS